MNVASTLATVEQALDIADRIVALAQTAKQAGDTHVDLSEISKAWANYEQSDMALSDAISTAV